MKWNIRILWAIPVSNLTNEFRLTQCTLSIIYIYNELLNKIIFALEYFSLTIIAILKSGDAQLITAGSGIVHSEMPSDNFYKRGGKMEGFQLWINVPSFVSVCLVSCLLYFGISRKRSIFIQKIIIIIKDFIIYIEIIL